MTKIKNSLLFLLGLLLPLQAGLYWEAVEEHYLKLCYLPILGLWLFCTKKTRTKLNSIGLVAVVLIVWSTFSALFARDTNRSLFEISRYVVVFLLYLYIANHCDDEKSIMSIFMGLFVSLLFEDFIGLYQNRMGQSIGWDFLGEGTGKLWFWRAIGTFRFPNTFGTYLIFLLPVMISLLFSPLRKKIKYSLGFLVALSTAVLIYTYSRSSWVAFAFSMMVFLALLFKRGFITLKLVKRLAPVAIIALIFVFYYSGKILDRWEYRDRNESGIKHRYVTAEKAKNLMKEKPLFGVGLRNFYLHANHATVHSTYLRLGAESGVPSLILFAMIFFFIYKEGLKVMKSKHPLISRLTIGILCAYSAFIVVSFVGIQYRWFPILAIFWLYAGLISAMSKFEKKKAFMLRKQRMQQIKNQHTEMAKVNTSGYNFNKFPAS